MADLSTLEALSEAMDNSSKIAQTPGLMTVVDRLFGFKLSEWKTQGELIRNQMHQDYKDAVAKGLGFQHVQAFRENANILNTITKATEYIKEGYSREINLDEDVFWNLIDLAKKVSKEEVQELISKIIAGEYNNPGTYSISTLQVLKSLGQREIILLQKAYALLIEGKQIPECVFRVSNNNYGELLQNIDMRYEDFLTLQSLGLFYVKTASSIIKNPTKLKYEVTYYDKKILYNAINDTDTDINVPEYHELTEVGKQIVKHLEIAPNDYYFNWLKENYVVHNYQIVI